MLEKSLVTVLGVLLVVLVNWYFLFSKRKEFLVRSNDKGFQEVNIEVKGGYNPDVIVVQKRIPVRLNFYRNETADCSDTIVFNEFNISKALPAFKTTAIEFLPKKEGEYDFTCGMGMIRGKVIVR